jgi:hypothetical protein
MSQEESSWIPLRPKFSENSSAGAVFSSVVQQLTTQVPDGDRLLAEQTSRIREEGLRRADQLDGKERAYLRVIVSVLCDLVGKGWLVRLVDSNASIGPPREVVDSPHGEKARVRDSLLVERDRQLRQPAVRAFVRAMERRRLTPCGWGSIFTLVRDGRDLGRHLREANAEPTDEARQERLRKAVDPYLQFINGEECCEFTGHRLLDIWRYFRHTWSTPYTLPPGRKILILVRDRAAPNHPVIGIAALGNAIVQARTRDKWIGWTTDVFLERLKKEPSKAWAEWLQRSLEDMFEALYVEDLIDDGLLSRSELRDPSDDTIKRLREESGTARDAHGLFPEVNMHKTAELGGESVDWEQRARTHLFRFKRAALLAQLLQVRRMLCAAGFHKPTASGLRRVVSSATGRQAVELVLRRTKAIHVGVDMLDIIVCGAIAPYQAILGGKLVAMLLTSPEVVLAYERRYKSAVSLIASSIAGRPVSRRPRLVLLSTTSLYGVGSSMYNRISIPAEEIGGRTGAVIRYEKLGKSSGFGSVQFSPGTINEIETLIAQNTKGRRVNSIFGEGVSPRLRKARSGLDLVGFPSDLLLKHHNKRIVYGVALAERFRDVLLGLCEKVPYIAPFDDPEDVTRRIGDFWARRWLSNRIRNPKVIAEVERHTLVYPIEHGARVRLPEVDGGQLMLFPLSDR